MVSDWVRGWVIRGHVAHRRTRTLVLGAWIRTQRLLRMQFETCAVKRFYARVHPSTSRPASFCVTTDPTYHGAMPDFTPYFVSSLHLC